MRQKLYESSKIFMLFIAASVFIFTVLEHNNVWESLLGLKDVKKFGAALETSYGNADRILRPHDKAWKPMIDLIQQYSSEKLPVGREPKMIARSHAIDSGKFELGGKTYQWTAPTTPFFVSYVDTETQILDGQFIVVGTLQDIRDWSNRKLSDFKFLIIDIILGILSLVFAVLIWCYEKEDKKSEDSNLPSSKGKMKDKEKADCLIELYKQKLDHFKQTREIEFKVNLALWALIATTGSFLYSKGVKLGDSYLWLAVIIFLMHLVWMLLIQYSEDRDHGYMNKYLKLIEGLSGTPLEEPEARGFQKILSYFLQIVRCGGMGWIFLEIAVTAALLIGSYLLLSTLK